MLITLKPLADRDVSATQVIDRLQPKIAAVTGATLYMQAVQDLTIDTRVSRTQYQYSVGGPNAGEVAQWSGRLLNKFRTIPILNDVASD